MIETLIERQVSLWCGAEDVDSVPSSDLVQARLVDAFPESRGEFVEIAFGAQLAQQTRRPLHIVKRNVTVPAGSALTRKTIAREQVGRQARATGSFGGAPALDEWRTLRVEVLDRGALQAGPSWRPPWQGGAQRLCGKGRRRPRK